MSQNDMGAPGHSGYTEPKVMASSDQKSTLTLDKAELEKIKGLIEKERAALLDSALAGIKWQTATTTAKNACEDRDSYCLAIEKKYGIKANAKWDISLETGVITLL